MVSERRSESWCFVVHHGRLFSRRTIFPHCLHFCPFSCLLPDGAEWVLPINPLQLLFSQNRLIESCTRDGGRGLSQHARRIQDAPTPPLKAGPGSVLLRVPIHLQWSHILMRMCCGSNKVSFLFIEVSINVT